MAEASQTRLGKGELEGKTYVAVDTGEPALLQDLGVGLASGLLPDGGREWPAVFVKREGLEGVFDDGGYSCVYKRVFFWVVLPKADVWDTEGPFKGS